MATITEKKITLCGHGSGNPSTKNMATYLDQRYNTVASNGVHKGVVAVMRFKKMTNAKRKEYHDTYKILLGRNNYDQNRRSYVYTPYTDKKYYSDCSSSAMATLKKIGFDVSLLNTAGIYQSSLFEKVPVKIVKGHIVNPEMLEVADFILFAGSDPSRPLQIGHVEVVYEIDGKTTTKKPKVPVVYPITKDNYKKHPKAMTNLHKCLNYLGYTNDKGKRLNETGGRGASFKQAMKSFQKANGLKATADYTEKEQAVLTKLIK